MKWIVNRTYRPDRFGEPAFRFMGACEPGSGPQERRAAPSRAGTFVDTASMTRRFPREGEEEMTMARRIERAGGANPALVPAIGAILLQSEQVRHAYASAGYWDPALVGRHARPS